VRIAQVLDEQPPPSKNENVDREYEVKFRDDTGIASDSSEIFQEESLTSYGRPVAIRMTYRDYERGRHISVSLTHGYEYGNEITVSGKDIPWVNANFLALKDRIERVRPQTSWILRHDRLLLHLIALG